MKQQIKNSIKKSSFAVKIVHLIRNLKNRGVVKNPERLHPSFYQHTIYDKILFLKHQFAYEYAEKLLKPQMNVLDYGCGDGYGSHYLASNENVNVVGTDIDDDTIKFAKKKYQKTNLNFITFEQFFNYSGTFDLITSFQVIEHVENVSDYLFLLKTKLTKNGILIISTPSRNYRLTEFQKPWNSFHLREYNMDAFKTDINAVFDSVRYFSLSAIPEVLKIEFERVKNYRDDQIMFMNEQYDTIQCTEKQQYTTNDFYLSENQNEINNGLDLFAIIENILPLQQ